MFNDLTVTGKHYREPFGAFNLVFGTVHLKRVISPADVQSPLGRISQANKAYLEVLVLSSGLVVSALIMVEGRLFILVIYFFLRLKSWVSRVGRRFGVC